MNKLNLWSFAAVLCLFAGHNLRAQDTILVEPGHDHLKELREIIYKEVKKTDPQDLSFVEEMGFSVVDTQPLQFKTGEINNEQIHNLLIMTPHFYRATKEGREAASKLQKLELTVDVIFRTLQKTDL